MAAKGAPRAASAPNSSQMTSAPMSLRSVMSRFAEGGGVQNTMPQPMTPPPPQVSAADINSFVQANVNNPQAIADAIQKYGVSQDALSNAIGYSGQQINDYFSNAGLTPFGVQPQQPMAPTPQMPMEPTPPRPGNSIPDIYYPEPTMPGFPEPTMPGFPSYEKEQRMAEEEDRKRQRDAERYYYMKLNEQRKEQGDQRVREFQKKNPVFQQLAGIRGLGDYDNNLLKSLKSLRSK